MLPLQKILCPTDFSEFSHLALDKAGELAALFDAELIVAHVVEPILPTSGLSPDEYMAFNPAEYEKEAREAANTGLAEIIARPQFDTVRAWPLVESGHSAETIVKMAREEKVDLLVISTHGHTGWRQWLFGSIAEKVLRTSPCPVMVVRSNQGQVAPQKIVIKTMKGNFISVFSIGKL